MLLGDVLILVNENSWGTCTHTRPKQIREGKYHNRLLPSKFNLVPIPNFFFFLGYQPMKLSVLVVKRQPLELRMGDVDGLWWPHAMSASGGHSFPFLSFTPLKWKKGIVNQIKTLLENLLSPLFSFLMSSLHLSEDVVSGKESKEIILYRITVGSTG